jgi:hypothetical protein
MPGGIGGGKFYVGLDTGSFPVGLGDGVDGAGRVHADHEVVVNAVAGDGMGAAPGGFCHSIPTGCQFRPTVD